MHAGGASWCATLEPLACARGFLEPGWGPMGIGEIDAAQVVSGGGDAAKARST